MNRIFIIGMMAALTLACACSGPQRGIEAGNPVGSEGQQQVQYMSQVFDELSIAFDVEWCLVGAEQSETQERILFEPCPQTDPAQQVLIVFGCTIDPPTMRSVEQETSGTYAYEEHLLIDGVRVCASGTLLEDHLPFTIMADGVPAQGSQGGEDAGEKGKAMDLPDIPDAGRATMTNHVVDVEVEGEGDAGGGGAREDAEVDRHEPEAVGSPSDGHVDGRPHGQRPQATSPGASAIGTPQAAGETTETPSPQRLQQSPQVQREASPQPMQRQGGVRSYRPIGEDDDD